MKNKIIAIAAILAIFVLFQVATTQVPNILPISPIGMNVLFEKNVTIEGNLEVEGAIGGTTSGTGAFTSVTADSITVPILNGVTTLGDTTTATILSKMTTETQHHIGCLIISSMDYLKTLYLSANATDSAPKAMYHADIWYDFAIATITGTVEVSTITFDATGYPNYENNFTVEDTSYIVDSTDNDGTYTFRDNATRSGEIISVYPNETLTSLTADGSFLKHINRAYHVPTGKVFLAGKVCFYIDHGYNRGRVGASTSSGGAITANTGERMCFGNGGTMGGNQACPGVFTAGEYVTGESTGNYSLRTPTFVYGIEVEVDGEGAIVDDVTVLYDIGGYVCEDYRDLKTLWMPDEPTSSSRKTFHDGASNYFVPSNKIYIAGKISYWTDYATNKGIIGESDTADASLSREVFLCGDGTINTAMEDVYGLFNAGKYVTAKTTSGFSLRKPTFLYGVEIDK